MFSGLSIGFKFVTCVPGRRKCHVAPALAIAISVAILICDVLNIISVSLAEFIASSAVNALRCVLPLEKFLMTNVFLS